MIDDLPKFTHISELIVIGHKTLTPNKSKLSLFVDSMGSILWLIMQAPESLGPVAFNREVCDMCFVCGLTRCWEPVERHTGPKMRGSLPVG